MEETSFAQEDFDPIEYYFRCVMVPSPCVKHIIGNGGHTLCKIESFVSVFTYIEDMGQGTQIALISCPWAYILAEFTVEMLEGGHYSIMESLVEHRF